MSGVPLVVVNLRNEGAEWCFECFSSVSAGINAHCWRRVFEPRVVSAAGIHHLFLDAIPQELFDVGGHPWFVSEAIPSEHFHQDLFLHELVSGGFWIP